MAVSESPEVAVEAAWAALGTDSGRGSITLSDAITTTLIAVEEHAGYEGARRTIAMIIEQLSMTIERMDAHHAGDCECG